MIHLGWDGFFHPNPQANNGGHDRKKQLVC